MSSDKKENFFKSLDSLFNTTDQILQTSKKDEEIPKQRLLSLNEPINSFNKSYNEFLEEVSICYSKFRSSTQKR